MIKICNIKLLLPNRTQSIRSIQRRTLGIQLCGAFYFLGVKDKLLKWKQKKIKIKLQDVAVSEKHDINQWVLVQWAAIFVMQTWHSKWPRGYKNIWSHLQMSLWMETLQKCLITVHSEAQSNLYFCFIQMHCHDNYISRAWTPYHSCHRVLFQFCLPQHLTMNYYNQTQDATHWTLEDGSLNER